MHILVLFAFLGGIITILSPCILPILPIVLSSATVGSKRYPLGIVTGFILSFTFFTLFLTTLVNATGISSNALRYISVTIIFIFGLILLIPQLKHIYERWTASIATKASRNDLSSDRKTGFGSGIIVGTSLGLVWTPCVGPILASVIALALTGSITGFTVIITMAYALGTALPMLLIMYGGRTLLKRVPWLLSHLEIIQQFFGALLIIIAVAISLHLDSKFQSFVLKVFPNYGSGLTQIEDNDRVKQELEDALGQSGDNADGQPMNITDKNGQYPLAAEIIPTGQWFNSTPLTLAQLKGKVVLIDFWTYSCINCIRTLPYIQAWHEQYAQDGLVIIGVHTPEFEFEKDAGNVAAAIKNFGLTYPIVQDNDYKTWRAYNNRYWPAKYFIDAQGRLRSTHFGEGEYEESEELIRTLLKEAGQEISNNMTDTPDYEIYSQTPETYLGHARIANIASPEKIKPDLPQNYTNPSTNLLPSQFAYQGTWTIGPEQAAPSQGSTLTINFNAKEVFLVMRPKNKQESAQVTLSLDGQTVTETAGNDVKDSQITLDNDRLYHLIKLAEPGQHLLEITFDNSNIEVYAFTFG